MRALFFTIFIFCFIQTDFSQPLELLHPSLPSDEITGIHFLNSAEVIFINAGGGIYKSYDAGNTWELKKHYLNYHLKKINFLDETTGFVVCSNTDELLYTKDGGETWQQHSLSVYPAFSFLPVSESVIIKSYFDGIERLDNYFNDWKLTYEMPQYGIPFEADSSYLYYEPYGSINKLIKLNNGNIIALGTNDNAFYSGIVDDSLTYLLISKDNAFTWDTLWIGMLEFARDILFSDDNTGWMLADSLYKSTDGGITWNSLHVNSDSQYFIDVFADGNSLYLLTWYNNILRSTDSGATWTTYEGISYGNNSISFNGANGFIFGNGLYKTSNSGQNWNNLIPFTGTDVFDIEFFTPDDGIALVNTGLFKTYDGGKSWILKFNPEDFTYYNHGSIEMLNDSLGWFLTSNFMYKTIDGGETWTEVGFFEKDIDFQEIIFCNNNLGLITASEENQTGYSRFITDNGGESWHKQPLDTLYFDRLKFTDPGHLWGSNRWGLWVSYDTAKTWKNIYGGDNFSGGNAFDFYDSLFGVYSVSYWGSLITTNGGNSWISINKDVGSHVVDCKILGREYSGMYRLLESGSNGVLMRTYIYPNGELDYYGARQLTTYTGKSLNTIEVLVEDDFPYVWAAGSGFTILYRQFEKNLTGVGAAGIVPDEYMLLQNYPNPFNPVTTIEYYIPRRSFVSLKIYDILGKEISTLVNEEVSAGQYKVEFNAGSLSSGVYIYRLQSGNFIDSKKFILVK